MSEEVMDEVESLRARLANINLEKARQDAIVVQGIGWILTLLAIGLAVFAFTEGPVTYCYVHSYSGSSNSFCLYGHEDWRTDRKLGCSDTPDALVKRAQLLSCPLEGARQ